MGMVGFLLAPSVSAKELTDSKERWITGKTADRCLSGHQNVANKGFRT